MIAATNVYADNGKATLDSKNAKGEPNALIVATGTPVDDASAETMGLPALFEGYNAAAVAKAEAQNDPLAVLKASAHTPKAIEAAAKLPSSTEAVKAATTPVEAK